MYLLLLTIYVGIPNTCLCKRLLVLFFKILTFVLEENKLNWVSGNWSMTLCNLSNAFHSLGLETLSCQVKELKVVISENLSSSASQHCFLSLA